MPEMDIQDEACSYFTVGENWESGGSMLACHCTRSLCHAVGWLRLVFMAGPGGRCCPEQIKNSLASDLLPAVYPGTQHGFGGTSLPFKHLQLDHWSAIRGTALALAFCLALPLGTIYRWRKYQKLFWEHVLFKALLLLPLRTGGQTQGSRWALILSLTVAGHKVRVGILPP